MISAAIVNHYQFLVNNQNKSLTALYLIKGDEVVERTKYTHFAEHVFNLRSPGYYSIRWFSKDSTGKISRGQTNPIRFRGFSGFTRTNSDSEPSVALYGINPYTIYCAFIISQKFQVLGIIDPTGSAVGSSLFEFDIISYDDAKNCRVIRYSSNRMAARRLDYFSTLPGRSDLLTDTLHLFNIMDLYRLSRELYLRGLIEGAKHIQGFIFSKFNCRIPYQAVIGEGTRIGIGGIGVVIHPDSIIGENCVIAQNVTLGGRAGGNGTPVVGNNVWISPGAKCLGGKIGNNVVVGANAVVIDEVGSDCVVAGVPARVISTDMQRYSSYIKR